MNSVIAQRRSSIFHMFLRVRFHYEHVQKSPYVKWTRLQALQLDAKIIHLFIENLIGSASQNITKVYHAQLNME